MLTPCMLLKKVVVIQDNTYLDIDVCLPVVVVVVEVVVVVGTPSQSSVGGHKEALDLIEQREPTAGGSSASNLRAGQDTQHTLSSQPFHELERW